MKKIICCATFLLIAFEISAQFSLGADLVGVGFSGAKQNEIDLKPDSSLSTSRVVFSVYSDLVGAYRYNQWEFSLGIGHKNTYWKQKFNAPTEDVKAFLGSSSLSDSSDFLGKISYSSRLVVVPVGVKYLIGRKPDSWVNAFLSAQMIPSIVYQKRATPGYFDHGYFFFIPVRGEVQEDPALVEATRAYFQPKINPVQLDVKAELGLRLWGKKRKYCVDLSLGMIRGFIPLHEQMGLSYGYFSNLALRFFFNSKSKSEGLI